MYFELRGSEEFQFGGKGGQLVGNSIWGRGVRYKFDSEGWGANGHTFVANSSFCQKRPNNGTFTRCAFLHKYPKFTMIYATVNAFQSIK